MSCPRHLRIGVYKERYRRLIETLREPHVRDLAWLLLSNDLLSAVHFPVSLACVAKAGMNAQIEDAVVEDEVADQMLAIDAVPEALMTFLASGERARLGRYAERLLHFFLALDPRHELLAAGLQIRDARRGGMTLGECDFLLRRCADAVLLHWELAVKLYLYVPPDEGAFTLTERALQFHWLGPNLADSLADKVERLVDHQLRLTGNDAARGALPAVGPWLPQVYLKGWLFHPLGEVSRLPLMVASDHGRGWWADLPTWWAWSNGAVNGAAAAAWAVLPRGRWLAPARVVDDDALTLAEVRARIETLWAEREAWGGLAEPLMVVALRPEIAAVGDVPVWHERERGFVVPLGWRERALHRIDQLASRAAIKAEAATSVQASVQSA